MTQDDEIQITLVNHKDGAGLYLSTEKYNNGNYEPLTLQKGPGLYFYKISLEQFISEMNGELENFGLKIVCK